MAPPETITAPCPIEESALSVYSSRRSRPDVWLIGRL